MPSVGDCRVLYPVSWHINIYSFVYFFLPAVGVSSQTLRNDLKLSLSPDFCEAVLSGIDLFVFFEIAVLLEFRWLLFTSNVLLVCDAYH